MWYAIRKGKDFKIVCCSGKVSDTYPDWTVIGGPCKKESDLFSPIVSVLYKEHKHESISTSSVSQHIG